MCEPDCEHCEPSFDLDEFIQVCTDTPAPKRRKRIRWKTIDGYDAITDRLKEKGHTLAINRQQWLKAKFKSKSKIPVICGKCGKKCTNTMINSLMNTGVLGCSTCNFRYSTVQGFIKVKARVEDEMGYTLMMSESEWLDAKMNQTSKPIIKCKYCSKITQSSTIVNLMKQGIGCPNCILARMSERRTLNNIPCNGACGNVKCMYIAHSTSSLNHHCGKYTKECPVCHQRYSYVQDHMRRVHPDQCSEFGIQDPQRQNYIPESLLNVGLKGFEYSFLVNKIDSLFAMDAERDWGNDTTNALMRDRNNQANRNDAKHALAREIFTQWLATDRGKNRLDDIGGCVPMEFRSHAAWSASLDRIDDAKPHVASNLQLVPLRMQGCTGVTFAKDGSSAVSNLQKLYEETQSIPLSVHEIRVKTMLSNAKQWGRRENVFHQILCNTRTRVGKGSMLTIEDIYERFKLQNGLCAVSGFILRDYSHVSDAYSRRFLPSVDRIDSRKGYTRDNIRIVALSFNAIDMVRRKKWTDAQDGDQQWSRQSFLKYIGL